MEAGMYISVVTIDVADNGDAIETKSEMKQILVCDYGDHCRAIHFAEDHPMHTEGHRQIDEEISALQREIDANEVK